jgi:quercetin dioxygenase-like cupin family protein
MAELHEVVSGQGIATIGKNVVVYTPGVVSFIPADVEHSVTASGSGLVLNAKFIRK